MTPKKNIDSIQALRGLASLAVMFFHFRWILNSAYPELGDKLFGFGALGVDVFFIISGFVITLSVKKSTPGLLGTLDFYKNRMRRILPAYYFWLLVTFLLSGAMSIFHYPEKADNLISAVTFSPLYNSNAPFYIDDSGMYGIRWTLNYEIAFYALIGIGILFRPKYFIIPSIFLFTLVILPFYMGHTPSLDVTGYQLNNRLLNLISNPMIYLFLAGACIGLSVKILYNIPQPLALMLLIIWTLAAYWLISHMGYVGHGIASSGWIFIIFTMLVIANEKLLSKLIPKLLLILGDISYSLYLIHTIMNTGVDKRLTDLGLQNGIVKFLIFSSLSIGLAYLSYKFIEKPFYAKKTKNQEDVNTPSPKENVI